MFSCFTPKPWFFLTLFFILSFRTLLADDITVGDLSARLDSLEKRLDGQTPLGEDYPTPEDIDMMKKTLKILTGRVEELENLVYTKLGIKSTHEAQTVAIGPAVTPPDPSETPEDDTDSQSGPYSEESTPELAILKSLEDKSGSSKDKNSTEKRKTVDQIRAEKTREAEKTAPSLETGTPLAQYDTAMALFSKKEYDKAQRAFADFIKNNGKDKLVHQAYYWQGECFQKLGKPGKAKGAFVQSYQQNKAGSKAADALYGLGEALSAEKNQSQACTAWRKLKTDFPQMSEGLKKKLQQALTKNKC